MNDSQFESTADMWWVSAVADAFATPSAVSRVQIIRLFVGIGCTWKFAQAFAHGGWNRFGRDGSFETKRLEAQRGRGAARLVRTAYRPILLARVPFALLLLAGLGSHLAAIGCILGLAFDLTYEFRRNVLYIMLLLTALLTSPNLSAGLLRFSPEISQANTFTACLIALLVTDVYWNSAYWKFRSTQFNSGQLLAQHIHFRTLVQDRLPYREFYIPTFVARGLGGMTTLSIQRWKILSRLAMVIEVLLPIGLGFAATYPYAVVAGILMHAAFTLLLPWRLVPFGVTTVAGYLAFQP